jgi:SAM-dependent methyltransferase
MKSRFEKIIALPRDRSDNSARVERVLGFARGRGRGLGHPALLDVGAGLGVFPHAMRAAGWSVTALEPDPRTVAHLKDVVGVEALADDLVTFAGSTSTRFQAVSFNKVLEHVEDPVSLLAAARPLLALEGFVYLEVPDVAAAKEGPEREEFFIEHHHVFSVSSASLLAARAGYRAPVVHSLREPSGKFTIAAFLVDAAS